MHMLKLCIHLCCFNHHISPSWQDTMCDHVSTPLLLVLWPVWPPRTIESNNNNCSSLNNEGRPRVPLDRHAELAAVNLSLSLSLSLSTLSHLIVAMLNIQQNWHLTVTYGYATLCTPLS
jgi:hypothetical protein